jgi:ATP-dependent protease ClpP protease subunit
MTEIYIYDDIGPEWWGLIGAKTVLGELDKASKGAPVTVRINSPGGDVVEAQAIYNALRRHSDAGGQVIVEIDALAASAASYVAMAGDTIRIAENAMLMIHNAWTVAFGNASEMRSTADLLDKFDGIITATYSSRVGTKSTRQQIVDWMLAETWMTANEAVNRGFADEIGTPLHVAAAVKEGRFRKMPAAMDTGGQNRREISRGESLQLAKEQIRLTRRRMGV